MKRDLRQMGPAQLKAYPPVCRLDISWLPKVEIF